MSNPGRLIRLVYSLTRSTVMTTANSMSIVKSWGGYAAAVIVRFKAIAPYALIELILPGGSVMALLSWLYRRRKNEGGFGRLPVRLLSFLRLVDPLRCNAAVCAARSGVGSMTASNL
jgi:hypothetical protein